MESGSEPEALQHPKGGICQCSRPDLLESDGTWVCQGCGSLLALEATDPQTIAATHYERPPALILEASVSQCPEGGENRIHEPIEQNTEIRIFEMFAGRLDEPIRGRLVTCRVDNAEEYKSISYTWADEEGDATKKCSIEVNGNVLAVTRNCLAALKRAREHRNHLKTRLWIDAVCIDQENLKERGHQVSLMPQIYSQATTVFVYVGEHAKDSELVMRYLAEDRDLLKAGVVMVPFILESYKAENPDRYAESLRTVPIKDIFRHFFSRRYFSRLWVLQEISLARKAVVLCGDSFLPWNKMTIESLRLSGVAELLDSVPSAARLRHPYDERSEISSDWLMLLDFGRSCQAIDPRDKVYGLLGLMAPTSDGELPFTPDYTKTTERLYIDVALRIWQDYGLRALLQRIEPKRREGIRGLPSWVPDWTCPAQHSLRHTPGFGRDDIPDLVSPHFYDHDSKSLTVLGFQIEEEKPGGHFSTWCVAKFNLGGEQPGLSRGDWFDYTTFRNKTVRLISSVSCKLEDSLCLQLQRVGDIIRHPPSQCPDGPLWRFTPDDAELISGRDFQPSRSMYRIVGIQYMASQIYEIAITKPRSMVCDADNNWELKTLDVKMSFKRKPDLSLDAQSRTTYAQVKSSYQEQPKQERYLRTFSLC